MGKLKMNFDTIERRNEENFTRMNFDLHEIYSILAWLYVNGGIVYDFSLISY